MKILFQGLNGEFDKGWGSGIRRYMYELYQRLKSDKNFNIIKLEYTPLPFIGDILSLSVREFTNNFKGYDIVHNLLPVIFPRFKVPGDKILISTVHEFDLYADKISYSEFLDQNGFIPTTREYLWHNYIIKSALNSQLSASDYLIARSSQTKEEAIKLGFPKKNIFVINSGLDRRFLTKVKVQRDKNSFIAGYIGSFYYKKNVPMILETANYINDPNIKIQIFGKPDYQYEKIKSMAKPYKNKIELKGFIPEEKLVKTYASFDVFFFPSLYEGLGLPILEAQACGVPVIIYGRSKMPKEITKYCFKANTPEQAAEIIQNLKLNGYNKKIRIKAKIYAQKFTWEKCAEDTKKIYTSIT